MKKKFLALILALSLTLALASCGEGAPDGSTPQEGGDTPSIVDAPQEEADTPSIADTPQKEVDLTEFYNALLEENEWPELMMLDDKELLDGFYPGLSEISAKQCLVSVAAISAAVGELSLAEAENAEDAEKIAGIFQARIDYQVGDDETPGGAWYPMTIEGWEQNSRIVTQGNYVMLAVGDYADHAVERFNALFA